MKAPKDAKARKEAQRKRDKVLGIERVECRLSIREREQLKTLCAARAGRPVLAPVTHTAQTSTSAP
ncbi:hypothetical protein [Aeromonas allosaccharophila]|uniref:hypothetical protein n=1 Tax=Aeromonas allosaccharophila TaxID=656 RepID=UPI00341204F1